MHSERILGEIRRVSEQLFGHRTGSVYLYGSRARGDASDSSDWDLLIITDDTISSADDFERFAMPFAEIGWRHGEQITPLIYTRSQWEAQRDTLFFRNVETDRILL